jgi:predicted metal-dependent hydrolase
MIKLNDKSKIRFNGQQLIINYLYGDFIKHGVSRNNNMLSVYCNKKFNNHKEVLESYLRTNASKYIKDRVRFISNKFNLEFNRAAVKDTKTRWGSCSSNKNININWRLIFAPEGVLDYVIIHELAHTIEMNHSQRFWKLVEKMMPEYMIHNKWLKDNPKNLVVS